jgi:hypothetical protein
MGTESVVACLVRGRRQRIPDCYRTAEHSMMAEKRGTVATKKSGRRAWKRRPQAEWVAKRPETVTRGNHQWAVTMTEPRMTRNSDVVARS